MRRYLPHRTTLAVALVMLVASSLAYGAASRVVEENEERLLVDRTSDVATLLGSLGTSYEAQMSSVAAVAQVTGGDAEQFRTAVVAADSSAEASRQAGWALLRRTPAGYEEVTAVGTPTPVQDLPTEWSSATVATSLDVAGQFRSRAASLPVLYMSGYGADLLTGDGRAPDGTVLAKPFSEDALLGAVRAAVEAP